MTARGIQLAQFAASLAQSAGRFVTDRTELAGLYDLDLRWTPENVPARIAWLPSNRMAPVPRLAVLREMELRI